MEFQVSATHRWICLYLNKECNESETWYTVSQGKGKKKGKAAQDSCVFHIDLRDSRSPTVSLEWGRWKSFLSGAELCRKTNTGGKKMTCMQFLVLLTVKYHTVWLRSPAAAQKKKKMVTKVLVKVTGPCSEWTTPPRVQWWLRSAEDNSTQSASCVQASVIADNYECCVKKKKTLWN